MNALADLLIWLASKAMHRASLRLRACDMDRGVRWTHAAEHLREASDTVRIWALRLSGESRHGASEVMARVWAICEAREDGL